MKATIDSTLDELTATKVTSRWRGTIYEPETAAFGGPLAMAIAHELFHVDSDHVLRYLQRHEPLIGRRELSMLLCTALFHAAELDSFECGDVWYRIATLRPLPAHAHTHRLGDLAASLCALVTTPKHATTELFATDKPLSFARPWAAAFNRTGELLNQTAAAGRLDRGVRHILTHLVIFHWNRLGLSATTQALLARAARQALIPRN